MKVQDVPIGYKFKHGTKGEGEVIAKTKRTLTVLFDKCTSKVTYKSINADFSVSDF